MIDLRTSFLALLAGIAATGSASPVSPAGAQAADGLPLDTSLAKQWTPSAWYDGRFAHYDADGFRISVLRDEPTFLDLEVAPPRRHVGETLRFHIARAGSGTLEVSVSGSWTACKGRTIEETHGDLLVRSGRAWLSGTVHEPPPELALRFAIEAEVRDGDRVVLSGAIPLTLPSGPPKLLR